MVAHMKTKQKLQIIDLAGVMQVSQYFAFSCVTCRLIVHTDDCDGCPLFPSSQVREA